MRVRRISREQGEITAIHSVQEKEDPVLSLVEIARCTTLPIARIRRMIRLGMLESIPEDRSLFPLFSVQRAVKIERICRQLDLSLSAVGILMELVDRIDRLEEELALLRTGRRS